MDNLSLKSTQLIIKNGKFRLWSYTNERTRKTAYAATIGLELITHVDYLSILEKEKGDCRVFYDAPERFSEVFRETVNLFINKLSYTGELTRGEKL